VLVLAAATMIAAQHDECAKIVRSGAETTLVVNSIRPVDSIANTLGQSFGVVVSAEEPTYLFSGEFEDVSAADPEWSAQHPNLHYYKVPKRRNIEIRFPTTPNGTPTNVTAVLHQVLQKANEQMPFGYRLDVDGEFSTFVPTTTRDAAGQIVPTTPLLDRKVTIPLGTRTIAESAEIMAKSLSAQTGLRVSCCQTLVAGQLWGTAKVTFEAQDEPARKVLARLITLNQQSRVIGSRNYWLLRCDRTWCFIDVKNVNGMQCR
jgi:hypothetical protein